MGMKRFQSEICILLKRHADQWKLSHFKFSITQIHRPFLWLLLDLGKKIETVAWNPYLNTWTLCFYKERSVFWHESASRLQNVYCLNLAFLRSILIAKMISLVIFDGKMLFAWQKHFLSKFLWCTAHVWLLFTPRKSSVFQHMSASQLGDVYCLKRSEDLVEKILSVIIFVH